MKIHDTDIFDSITGAGNSDLERRIRQASKKDETVSTRVSQWTDVRADLSSVREARVAARDRVVSQVMSQIDHRAPAGTSHSRPRLASMSVGLRVATMAACAMLMAGVFVGSQIAVERQTVPASGGVVLPSEASVSANVAPSFALQLTTTTIVEFGDVGTGDGSELNPFRTLREGVVAVSQGESLGIRAGTSSEKLTIEKPIRLHAVGGSVRIGTG